MTLFMKSKRWLSHVAGIARGPRASKLVLLWPLIILRVLSNQPLHLAELLQTPNAPWLPGLPPPLGTWVISQAAWLPAF